MKTAFNIAKLDAEAINAITLDEAAVARQSLTDLKRNVATAVDPDKLKAFILNAAVVAGHVRDGLLDAAEASAEINNVASANSLHEMFGSAEVVEAIAKAEQRMFPSSWQDEVDIGGGRVRAVNGSREEIERLSQLSAIDYDREREAAANTLGIRVSTLDAQVQAYRAKNPKVTAEQDPCGFTLPEAKEWSEPVDGSYLLDEMTKEIRSYVVLSEPDARATALWALHTYALDRLHISPRIAITSPEKGCGKSTMKDVLSHLVCRPLAADNVSPAVLYYVAERMQPTFLLDEADSFLKESEDLRNVLNSGYRRNGAVVRMEKNSAGGYEPKNFSTWCATGFFLIGDLPATVQDRSIIIPLRRRSPEEKIKPYDPEQTSRLDDLASMCVRWMRDNLEAVAKAFPAMPGLYNRAADNWKPLAKIADVVGGEWPTRVRESYARAISSSSKQSMRETLLTDVRDIFSDRRVDRLQSSEICEALAAMEERPWPEFNRGKPITPNGLARLLRPFGITSENHRNGHRVAKCYNIAHFADAFSSYLPSQGADSRYSATSLEPSSKDSVSHPLQKQACSGSQTQQKPPPDARCSVVADEMPHMGDYEEVPL